MSLNIHIYLPHSLYRLLVTCIAQLVCLAEEKDRMYCTIINEQNAIGDTSPAIQARRDIMVNPTIT